MEELEFPMWSYVTPKELNGFIVHRWEVRKSESGLTLKDRRTLEIKTLSINENASCLWLNKWTPELEKVVRLKSSLLKSIKCLTK